MTFPAVGNQGQTVPISLKPFVTFVIFVRTDLAFSRPLGLAGKDAESLDNVRPFQHDRR
jgi:hypothetical protein